MAFLDRESFECRHGSARNTSCGCDARDSRRVVDEDRAATALTLGRTSVLYRRNVQTLTQDIQERLACIGRDSYGSAIAHEGDRLAHAVTLRPFCVHLLRDFAMFGKREYEN
jgi:hypothetical protein